MDKDLKIIISQTKNKDCDYMINTFENIRNELLGLDEVNKIYF